MAKIIGTLIMLYLDVYVLCNATNIMEYLGVIVLLLFSFTSILILWDIIPLCKLTHKHKPELKQGIYYCQYCKKPLSKR